MEMEGDRGERGTGGEEMGEGSYGSAQVSLRGLDTECDVVILF